ncbi:MAG: antitoxin Xre/MbcA/ParS toxin-binding domain-containing protein [Reichenbachiella sp.]|uniref:antitoxin Xre/MbcA/ParS toxin-binding domain-containing protein n=1 Tax=Reichenbachiella sp. TaxID=2184521 RepID=UPI0032989097
MSYKANEILRLINDPAVRYQKAHEGITKSDFLAVVSMTGMNLTEFSNLLPVSRRTLEKVKDEELISASVSDRILQIAALYQYGAEVLGGIPAFQTWLKSDLLALAHKKPYDFLGNSTGLSLVEDLLGRMEHGVYS